MTSADPPSYEASTYKGAPSAYQPPPYGATSSASYVGYHGPPPGCWVPPGHHFYAQPTGYSPGNPDYMHSHAYILSTESMGFQCPHCGCSVWSRTDYEFGVMTYLWSFLICLLFFPLFWVPFVCDYCKDVNHKCPQCNYQLAQLRRF